LAPRDVQPGAEVIPKSNAQFKASFCQAEEAVAAITTEVTARAAADLAPGYLSANVIFRSIGVERDFGTVEHHQQLGLVFVQPFEQTVERDEAGLKRKDAVESRLQDCLASLGRAATVGFQSAVVLPDQVTDVALGRAVFVGEGVELVNEPLCVNLILCTR
jgi:hypothetical protein